MSDGGLFLGAPRNKIATKVDKKPTGRATIRGIASPVNIAEGCEKHRRCMTKLKPMSDGAFEVAKKMLQASLVSNVRGVHSAACLIDSIADVGTGKIEILQGTDNATIEMGVIGSAG